jgi:RNA polymerase sigma factor for flagellar operon FliA
MNEEQARAAYAMEGVTNLETVAEAYLGRVERLAVRMADTYGLSDPDELVSAAHVALWEALLRYDPARADLHRYILVTVRQRLLDAIRRQSPLDHRQWQRLRALRTAWRRLEAENGRPPTDEELAQALGLSAAKLEELFRLEAQATSPVPLDGEAWHDGAASLEEQVAWAASLEQALRKLPDREQRILYAVYVGGYTTEEIAQALGLEASWVRRLRGRALAALRAELADEVPSGAGPPGESGTIPSSERGESRP